MTSFPEATERVWATVPRSVNDEIETRAAADGLKKPEWIRSQLVALMERHEEGSQAAGPEIERLAACLEARFAQLEARIFHENSAMLTLGFEIFKEAIHASIAAMSATTSAAPADDEEAQAKHRYVFADAEAHFNRRNDELFALLKAQRDEAKVKSRALGRPFETADDEAGEG